MEYDMNDMDGNFFQLVMFVLFPNLVGEPT